MLGNVLHPAYASSVHKDYPFPLSFIDRLKNLFYHLYVPGYWRVWGIVPLIQKAVSAHLPDAPPLLEIEKNTSLTLINSHFSFTKAMPLLPTQVEVGGMHCVPGKPLTQELASWVEGAGPSGVIFFSLGTAVSGNTMPVKYLDLFIEAFARLDYRFIWKFDIVLKNVSTNVLMGPFFPQQDILADHRVKLFITQGGMLSTQEAIHHATPVVAIPVFGDQQKNAMGIMKNGIGVALAWDDLTVDLIINTINEVINNPRYQRNVKQVSKLMRDQLQSPLERAVYWTEYVIRHQGAPHLKSPAAQISWVEFFMLDVLTFLLLCIIAIYLTLHKILRTVCNLSYYGVGHWKVKME
ncbi:UDP-glucosyltransferase 2-like [Homarus americanus]|nr:UDP-glucosyltransferase 2-like [Homarus americanus]